MSNTPTPNDAGATSREDARGDIACSVAAGPPCNRLLLLECMPRAARASISRQDAYASEEKAK
eukprot:9290098-Prorocentrum_lima.AAC.1